MTTVKIDVVRIEVEGLVEIAQAEGSALHAEGADRRHEQRQDEEEGDHRQRRQHEQQTEQAFGHRLTLGKEKGAPRRFRQGAMLLT